MATEIGRLIAIFEGDDRRYHATRKSVESGAKQTANSLTKTEREQIRSSESLQRQRSRALLAEERQRLRASESLQRQRSAALIAEWKRQEREAARSAKRIADIQIRESRRAADAQLREAKRWAGIGTTRGGGGASTSTSLIAGAAGGVTALLGVSAASTIREGASAWFEYASKLEATRIAFTTMLGSAREADNHLRDLQQFALKTPFEFRDLIDASQRMQALGFSAQQVIPVLNDVGNAVAASGGGAERLDRVVLAISQMQSKGKVATQELNQLAEAGIPGWKILEEQMGKSRAELVKLVEAGKISSKVFLEAFQTFSRNNFGNLMEQQSKTAIGALSNLKDAIFQVSERALAPLFKEIRDGLLSVSSSLLANQASWEQWGRKAVNHVLAVKTTLVSVIDLIRTLDGALARMSGLDKLSQGMSQAVDRQEGQTRRDLMTIAMLATMAKNAITGGASPTAPAAAEQGGMGRVRMDAQGRLIKEPVKDTTTTSGGGGGRGGRGGRDVLADMRRSLESAQRSTLLTLEIEERAVERSFEKRSLVVASFYRALTRLEETRHETVVDTLAAETKLAEKIKDPIEKRLALEDLGVKKLEESNRHREASWRLEDRIKELGRERIATTDALLKRLTRERQVLKEIAQERTRFASEIARQDLGGGSFILSPDVRDSITRPRVATTDEQAFREQLSLIREQMHSLAGELTNVFSQSISDGFNQGVQSGLQTLATGLLRIVEEVFLRRLAQGLGDMLTGFASGGGGTIWTTLGRAALSAIGGGVGVGFGGGPGIGGAGSALAGAIGRDKGGPIWPNQVFRLHKDETVVPTAPGFVIPKGMGQQTVINNHYHLNLPPERVGNSYRSKSSSRQLVSDLVAAMQMSQT